MLVVTGLFGHGVPPSYSRCGLKLCTGCAYMPVKESCDVDRVSNFALLLHGCCGEGRMGDGGTQPMGFT